MARYTHRATKRYSNNITAYLRNCRKLYESEIPERVKNKQVISAFNGKIDPKYFKDSFKKSVSRMIESLAACFRSDVKNIKRDEGFNIDVENDSVISTIVKYFKKKFNRSSNYDSVNKILSYAFKKCFYSFLYDYTGVDTIKDLNNEDKSNFKKFIDQVNNLTKSIVSFYNGEFKKYKVAPGDVYRMMEVMTDDRYLTININNFVDDDGDVKINDSSRAQKRNYKS